MMKHIKLIAILIFFFHTLSTEALLGSTQCEKDGGMCLAGAVLGCEYDIKKDEGCRRAYNLKFAICCVKYEIIT